MDSSVFRIFLVHSSDSRTAEASNSSLFMIRLHTRAVSTVARGRAWKHCSFHGFGLNRYRARSCSHVSSSKYLSPFSTNTNSMSKLFVTKYASNFFADVRRQIIRAAVIQDAVDSVLPVMQCRQTFHVDVNFVKRLCLGYFHLKKCQRLIHHTRAAKGRRSYPQHHFNGNKSEAKQFQIGIRWIPIVICVAIAF